LRAGAFRAPIPALAGHLPDAVQSLMVARGAAEGRT